MPKQTQQISINADRLHPKAREIEEQIKMEKRRWLWFDMLCVGAKPNKKQ